MAFFGGGPFAANDDTDRRLIAAAGADRVVVLPTADAFEDTRNLCMAAGFDGWLAKPFRIQDLARVMDLVLANRSPYKSPASQIL